MQDWPLTVNRFLEHASRWHGQREVASRGDDGDIGRKTYAEVHRCARQLSTALAAHGIVTGDRVATLAMNSAAHVEVWYAVSGIGAVCHTLNPRLGVETLDYTMRHAGDRILFADAAFAPLLAKLLTAASDVELVVFLTRPPLHTDLPVLQTSLEDFVRGHGEDCAWGGFDENTAAGLCYTSGTTGDPKGVLYSHRSNFLHTLITLQGDVFGITSRDTVMPVVPMYHANAWGMVFSAPAAGAKLVMPGARLDGRSLYELIEGEGVTVTAGVPTVWSSLLQYMVSAGLRAPTLRRVMVGGAACPERLMRNFAELGIEAVAAWGMTEMSPVGSVSLMTPEVAGLPFEEQIGWRMKQGRAPCGVDMKLKDAGGQNLPHDGKAVGQLWVKGPAVAAGYFRDERRILDAEGWFDTGDISTIDALGFMHIADRAKDIIKSGGEWVSSQGIENAAMMHPKVAAASVIGVPHPEWGERPLLLVVLKDTVTEAVSRASAAEREAEQRRELLEYLRARLVKWHVPDHVAFVTEFPLGATGKIDKRRLRELHAAGAFGI